MKLNKKLLMLVALLLIIVLLPIFITVPYIISIFITTFLTISCSLAWNILGGMTGQISLGHAAFMALGAYITTMLLNYFNISPWLSIIIVFFIVGSLGAVILSPCFVLHGAYFSLVTIAFGEAFRNLFLNWELAGKGQGLLLTYGKPSFALMRFGSKAPYFYISLVMMAGYYLVIKRIDHSKLGYGLKTIREDEDTAKAVGINPLKYKMIATFISSGMIAVCGVFYACYVRYVNPDIMMTSKSVEYVLPAIIGGLGSVAGPLIGGAILVPLSEYLNASLSSIANGFNLVVYSAIIIAVIVLQPSGITGWYRHSKLKTRINTYFSKGKTNNAK
ncbi:MAG: branched-chain amino acid ABC transporter permease [Spirochaetia bacterium]|jgi:branched-chain amino acid transport system permease protein|nr:branched-chain amino acid ABC transporter permease [Spirochaetia bacterium]